MAISKKRILQLFLLMILFLGLIVAWLGFGDRGFIHLYRMEKERQKHLERISQLEHENHELMEEIKRLRSDKKYIESMARKELGLVKDNEKIYRFMRKEETEKEKIP